MRYVRFLKTPRIATDKSLTKAHIHCLITITSDLGDSFLPLDVALSAELLDSESGDVIVWRTVQWMAGFRSLPVMLPLSKTRGPQSLVVRINVNPKSSYDELGRLSREEYRGVVAAWSAPLEPAHGLIEAKRLVERRFRSHNEVFSIFEETGESIARHLWDAGIALSCHVGDLLQRGGALQEALARLKHKKRFQVLELGSGCGMVGISIARMVPGADVLLTDLPEAREIIERNLAIADPAEGTMIRFQELDWGQELPPQFNGWSSCLHCQQIDLIVAADCTYNSDSSPALVRTLRSVASLSSHVTVAIAMKMRHSSEEVFFKLMTEAGFRVASTIAFPLPGDEKAGEETVHLYVYHFKGATRNDVAPSETCDGCR